MQRRLMLATTMILLLGTSAAHAESVRFRVTPKDAKSRAIQFDVSSKMEGELRKFRITIRRKSGEWSPFLNSYLSVYDGKKRIASCEVRLTRKKGELTLEFEVAPQFLEKSTYQFAEFSHVNGVAMPSAEFYWFYLGDFAEKHRQ